jgi:hypothetical protein
LYHQENLDSADIQWEDVAAGDRPAFYGKISLHPSAVATFYAPSDICGIHGMRRERIRAVPAWRKEHAQYDCVFVNMDPLASAAGFLGLEVARVRQFFSFTARGKYYPAALVQWFHRSAEEPDKETGMWIIERDQNPDGSFCFDIIHLDTIIRAAHLIGVFGEAFVPEDLPFNQSLDAFHSFYVNRFIDHHAFEIAS